MKHLRKDLTAVEKVNQVIGHNRSYISGMLAEKTLSSEYNSKAVDFLLETQTTCDIVFEGLASPPWDKKRKVNSYSVTLKNAKHSYTFEFFDSINNTEKGKKSTLDFYSVLACMSYTTPESFDEFCSEFGYSFANESEYIEAKSTHLSCLDQDKNLRKLFTSDELQKLLEIN